MVSVFGPMGVSSQALHGPERPRVEWERERKFVTTPGGIVHFLTEIDARTALRVHDPARPIAYNRTTYLDTDDLSFLRSSRLGPIARKLRIREYASAETPESTPALCDGCFLELKESGDSFRSKTRVSADSALLSRILENGTCGESDESLDAIHRLIRDEHVRPKLTTWYRRITRVSLDERIRITVDSGLSFASPVRPGDREAPAEPASPVARVPFSVVEVKCTGEVPEWLARALEPLREVPGFSKFEQGMAHLHPGVG